MTDINPEFSEPILDNEENNARHQWISVAAYYKSEKRYFAPGLELDDWLEAEEDYIEMLIATYLSIVEEDGVMTIVSLQKLAKEIGVPNPENLRFKVDLIRAIQDICLTRPCYQHNTHNVCDVIDGCQWRKECQRLIAIWKR